MGYRSFEVEDDGLPVSKSGDNALGKGEVDDVEMFERTDHPVVASSAGQGYERPIISDNEDPLDHDIEFDDRDDIGSPVSKSDDNSDLDDGD